MPPSDREFADYIVDLLAPMGMVQARRMFGGFGVFCEDLMFAIIDEGTLYFKVDASTLAAYEEAGLAPFTYQKQGKRQTLRYYQAPPDALEDPEELLAWARDAYSVARRAARE